MLDIATATPTAHPQLTIPGLSKAELPILDPAPTVFAANAERVAAIEALLARYPGSPLHGYALAMVKAAEREGIDWRLLPVIAVLESGAATDPNAAACIRRHNAWGLGSCDERYAFASWEEAIDDVARRLAAYGGDAAYQMCIWNQGATGCADGLAASYVATGLALMEGMR